MKCDNCLSKETYIDDYKHTYTVKGKEIEVTTKCRFCKKCGNQVYDEELDNITGNIVIAKYNEKYGLTSESIIELRNKYNLSQELFAKVIGCAKKTLISYEKGTSIPNDTYSIVLKSLLSKPDIIDVLVEANKDEYSDKEYNKIKSKILEFIANNRYIEEEKLDNLTEYNGYTSFNRDKIINMIIYFAKDGVLKTKLLKEMFYSDFIYYKNNGASITGLEYAKIDYGPVPNNKDDILNDCIINKYIKEKIEYYDNFEKHNIISLREFDNTIFREEELEVMKKIKDFFKDFKSKEIADFSHKEKGYIETEFAKNISYQYALDIDRI